MRTDIGALTIRVAGKLGIADASVRGALDTSIGELERFEDRTIDPDEISAADAKLLTAIVRDAQRDGDFGERELDDVADAALALEDAMVQRDRAICAALAAGARGVDVAYAAGLSYERVRKIRASQ